MPLCTELWFYMNSNRIVWQSIWLFPIAFRIILQMQIYPKVIFFFPASLGFIWVTECPVEPYFLDIMYMLEPIACSLF